MSYDKQSRAKRREQTQHAVDRQVRIHKGANWAVGYDNLVPGKYRKRKALNCGVPQCNMCGNPRHLWGYVTLAEQRAVIAMQQDLASLEV